MIEVFGCIALTALVVNGLTIATGDGMILEKLKAWLIIKVTRDVNGEPVTRKIYKPLIGCVKCMPSIYGTIICLCFLPFTVHLLYTIPVVILSSSTLAAIIHAYYI